MLNLPFALDLIVAALVGLALGIEREWTGHTDGPDARFAGIRTFAMLGVLGGFAGWFYREGATGIAVGMLAATMLFPIAAYASAMRRPGTTTDGTTEVAALIVAALGFTAGFGQRTVASAVAVVVIVLLAEKSALQRALKRADEVELKAAVQFAVLALIVLPLLPDGAYGPYDAIRPRALWTVVLLFSALNFGGYLARRIIGETRGLAFTGLLGGLVSSTAVTLNFSRRSRTNAELSAPLALGVIAACTVLLPRIALVCTVLRPDLGAAVLPVLAMPFAVGVAIIAQALWRARHAAAQTATDHSQAESADPLSPADASPRAKTNPLGLASALQMALAFQLVLFVIAFMQERIGNAGVLATASLLGLTDMDALTVSMTRLAADPAQTDLAARAIGIGVLSNTALKAGLALSIGASAFRARVAAGLGLLALASGIGLWLVWS